MHTAVMYVHARAHCTAPTLLTGRATELSKDQEPDARAILSHLHHSKAVSAVTLRYNDQVAKLLTPHMWQHYQILRLDFTPSSDCECTVNIEFPKAIRLR